MARGGRRPGTGGPRPGSGPKPAEPLLPPPDIQAASVNCGMTPLDYMLAVMRDPTADAQRRDRMAQAAAPFVHARPAPVEGGKKEAREAAGRTAEMGTSWEAVLN